jgi:3-hydroxyisobutyrate dehydrogenase
MVLTDTPSIGTINRMRAAFLGLGLMGYPMAAHLAKSIPTTVWNRTPEKAASHADEHGSQAAPTPGEAAGAADVLFTCLPTSREVEALVPAVLEGARSGLTWVDCTSGDPATSRRLAERLAERGVRFLDAPVSGGVGGAKAGRLTVMVGGESAVLEASRPAIETFAAKIVHVGQVGAGMAVKAANQAVLAVNILALAEVLAGLERGGVKAATALEVINASSGRSNASENLFPERVVGRAFPVTFTLGLLAKDVGIAASALREAGLAAPMSGLAESLLAVARHELGPDVDHVAAVQLLERWAGVEIGA